MSELFHTLPPAAAWQRFADALPTAPPPSETILTTAALDRILAAPIVAPHDLPDFRRSAMDGYAVLAADTWGATPGLPALLTLVGEAPMGQETTRALHTGEAMLVHTGGMLPPGADAVVMVEQTQRIAGLGESLTDLAEVEVYKPVASGENVIERGEDVRQGQALLAAGSALRAQELGGLLALGITQVEVARKPRVAILSTGDEVVPPETTPQPGQVRDINSHTLAALVCKHGGEPILCGIVRDDPVALRDAAASAVRAADMVIFSAGSSVSDRDLTVSVIDALGSPGVLVHGIAIKPGKPTILAVCNGKPVFGLPGNPVSAMVIFETFVGRAIRLLLGAAPLPRRSQRMRLARNLNSASGREDHVAVRVEMRAGEPWAVPVLGKSNLIYTLIFSEGTLIVPLDSNGIAAGEWVEVWS